MFRVSDPLGNYVQDPRNRQSPGRVSPGRVSPGRVVPNPEAESSSKKYYTIFIIAILIVGVVLIMNLKRHGNDESGKQNLEAKCLECLEFDKLLNITGDPDAAGNYLKDKINNITKSSVDNIDNVRPLSSYTNKLGSVTTLQEKVNEMTVLKGQLERLIAEANGAEKQVIIYREGYDRKVKEIEKLGNKSLSNAERIKELKKNVVESKMALESVNLDIEVADKDSKGKKKAFYDEIDRIKKQIEEKIVEAGRDEEQMDAFIRERERKIDSLSSEQNTCHSDIKRRLDRINELKRENQTHSDELFNVEYLYKSRRLELHNFEMSNKLEEVLKQLKDLQNASANDAKPYLEEILESLQLKQKEYMEVARRQTDEHRQNALASLRKIIEKEQDLLKTWGTEQLRAWRISKEEEKNITSSINTLRRSITSDLAELENLVQRKQNVLAELKRIGRLISEEQRWIDECNSIIDKSEGNLREIRRETEKMKNLRDIIGTLREQIKMRIKLFESEEGSAGPISDLYLQRKGLVEKIRGAEKDIRSAEDEVMRASQGINNLLKQGVGKDDMKKEVDNYKEKIRVIEETDGKIKKLAEEIKILAEY